MVEKSTYIYIFILNVPFCCARLMDPESWLTTTVVCGLWERHSIENPLKCQTFLKIYLLEIGYSRLERTIYVAGIVHGSTHKINAIKCKNTNTLSDTKSN